MTKEQINEEVVLEDVTTEEVEDVNTDSETVESEEESTDEVAELKKRNAILARQLKKAKKPKEEATSTEALSREEAKLYAKGLSDSEVDRVIKISKIDEITLSEAFKSDDYQIWKEKNDREEKRNSAQLGTSKGSRTRVKKTLSTPGLSPEERKQLWKDNQ